MNKTPLLLIALMSLIIMACGSKKGQGNDTEVVPDSLMNEAAVKSQVEEVYKYLNDVWRYYMETPVEQIEDGKWAKADDCFGTLQWRKVRHMVDSVDVEGERLSFFQIGDKGPLDPWQYDCFEGELSVQDITVTFNDDGTAQADFSIKDATTIEAVPIRWLLRVEEGKWRVADIIFVSDNNYDLLENMKAYLRQAGCQEMLSPSFSDQ